MSEFVISGFSDEISSEFSVQLETIRKMNIAYIEIRGVDGKNIVDHTLDEVRTIKQLLDESDIKVSSIGSPIGKISIEESFEPHFKTFKHTVELAKILETKYIRLFSFFLEPGTAHLHREEVIKRMKAMTEYVEGSDIILLHENEKEIYGDIPSRCLDLYKTMDSGNFKLIFDPANYIQCGVNTYPYAYEMLKEYVAYYHIKDALMADGEVVPSGYGDGHIPEIIECLHKGDYKGFLSLEPHLGYFEGFEALEGESAKAMPEFAEKSDAGKFVFAYESLKKILEAL